MIGTVIREFAYPGTTVESIAWDGRYLWSVDSAGPVIRQVDPLAGGEARTTFASPGAAPVGLTWDGAHLWTSDSATDKIYQVAIDGSVLRSFDAPAKGGGQYLAWDGVHLWVADSGTDTIYEVDPVSGLALRSFASPAVLPRGLAWDGRALLQIEATGDRVWVIDPVGGTFPRNFAAPAGDGRGIAWDGRSYWIADQTENKLYQVQATAAHYAGRVLGAGPIAYWPRWEPAGATAVNLVAATMNGTNTAVTLAQPGIGDGATSASYDGATSYTDVYSAALAAAFNGAEGTIALWAKVSGAGVWTDGITRMAFYIAVAANNRVTVGKSAVNNTLFWTYTAGGVNLAPTAACTLTTWMHLAVTWSASAGLDGEMCGYLNGAAAFATQTTLGVWAGALDNTLTAIGAQSTVPALVFSGTLAHCAVWDHALTPAEIAALATV